ncbi:MAG: Bug family tripartite tricarboxylate transporter substrate binding protein [Lawsonibacter sp.]|jgi:tripartite-type tricarboxylate transporter receptor subunit TctC
MKFKRILAVALCACMAAVMLSSCNNNSSSGSAGSGASASGSGAGEIDWPKQNITIICPFKAGGGMDLSTRLTAKYLEKYLGVTVTVSNVEGGNSWTGWTQVAQAKGDGYTLGFANYPAQVGGYLNPSAGIPFTYKDFSSIANVVSDPNVLWVSANHSEFNTAQEFIDFAMENSVVVGTGGGAGCDDDVCIAKINDLLGTKIESGRNSGFAEAKTAVLGGHMEAAISNVSEVYSMVGSTGADAIRILCIFATDRNDFIPDVPTWTECGYEEIINGSDRGLIGPASLDPAVKEKLIATLKEIEQDPDFLEDAKVQGMTIGMMYGDDFDAYIADIEATMTEMKPLFGWA